MTSSNITPGTSAVRLTKEKAKRRAPQSARNIDLGRIHQAKKALQMSDADYQAMLWTQARVRSAGDLDAGGRAKVIAYLQTIGYRPAQASRPSKPPLTPPERMVWALWYKLESLGRVRKPESTQARAKALRAFVKRQTGVDDLAFCNFAQTMNLIESMKSWVNRPEFLKDVADE